MKTRIFYLVLSLISTSFLYAQSISGDGDVVKKERSVEPFTSIETSHGWDLILVQGQGHSLIVEADANIHDHLITEVERGVLKVYFPSGVNIRKSKMRKIHLVFEDLEAIAASGGSDVEAKGSISSDRMAIALSGGSDLRFEELSTEKFSGKFSGGSDASINFDGHSSQNMAIQASGGSDLRVEGVNVESLAMQTSGGSDVHMDGVALNASVQASGGSDFDAEGLKIEVCTIDVAGSSDARIHVSQTLNANLGGGSDVECSGNPKVVHQQVCKSCDLSY